jgi:hypothetical protein
LFAVSVLVVRRALIGLSRKVGFRGVFVGTAGLEGELGAAGFPRGFAVEPLRIGAFRNGLVGLHRFTS